MKLLRDYTGAELEELPESHAQKLIDLECADAGLPFVPDAPGDYVPLKHEYDVRLYQIGNSGLLLRDRKEAEDVASFLKGYGFWDNAPEWKFGYQNVAKPSKDTFEVAAVEGYSPAKIAGLKDTLAKDAELKKAHEKATEEYTNAIESRQRVSDSVWGLLYRAWEFKSTRESLVRELDRYVALADGDEAIGLRFFQKARPDHSTYFDVEILRGLLLINHKHFTNPAKETEK